LTYRDVCERLKKGNIENARGEAELLISEICGNFSEYGDYSDQRLYDAVEKRCGGYPLQYIIGKWWFGRCEFEVSEHCLVPRPDTEAVVEEAVRLLPHDATFADLCTGSGCIAISIADLRTDTKGIAVELYPETLEIAKKNAIRNSVADRLEFKRGDVLSGEGLEDKRVFAVISNPPYIKSEEIETLSREVRYEPRTALDGGSDGLLFYRAIIDKYEKNIEDGGCFIFEIGYDQAEQIKEIALDRGFSSEIKKDLGGNFRVAVLRKK